MAVRAYKVLAIRDLKYWEEGKGVCLGAPYQHDRVDPHASWKADREGLAIWDGRTNKVSKKLAKPRICSQGWHAATKGGLHKYLVHSEPVVVFLVELRGHVTMKKGDESKICAQQIRYIRQLSSKEVKKICEASGRTWKEILGWEPLYPNVPGTGRLSSRKFPIIPKKKRAKKR